MPDSPARVVYPAFSYTNQGREEHARDTSKTPGTDRSLEGYDRSEFVSTRHLAGLQGLQERKTVRLDEFVPATHRKAAVQSSMSGLSQQASGSAPSIGASQAPSPRNQSYARDKAQSAWDSSIRRLLQVWIQPLRRCFNVPPSEWGQETRGCGRLLRRFVGEVSRRGR